MKKNYLVGLFVVLISISFSCSRGSNDASNGLNVMGPVQVTSESYPFNGADHTVVPQNIAFSGYIEEEYFVSGKANVYDYDTAGKVIVKHADAPYTTRILVRRPADTSRFSGNVVLELNNPTKMFDMDLQWMFCRDFFIENGDIWVGITVKPIALKALQKFNPDRYKSLSMDNPAPPDERCEIKPSTLNDTAKETENGLAWDIVSQIGKLLKGREDSNPLKGYDVKYLIATGYSQTGGYLTTYINLIHPLDTAKMADGRPIFDGYMIGDGDAFMVPINQCVDALPPGETNVTIKPSGVPVISVVTQGVLNSTIIARRPDSDDPVDRFRRYEIPGAAHVNKKSMDNSPNSADSAKAGVPDLVSKCEGVDQYGVTDFPIEFFMNSAYQNLYSWIRTGTLPPKAEPIVTEKAPEKNGITIKLDEHENALGGVRHPYVEAPVATYFGNSKALDEASGFFCSLAGYRVPFDAEKIKALYPAKEDYLKKVYDVTDKLVAGRLLTESDGERIKTAAKDVNAW
ncbi:MAG: hypothetical protein JW927_11490 [Deltaproteobacteria bacterium]|nr:hypothetical protein [Deltaproteobacteria bacterium]